MGTVCTNNSSKAIWELQTDFVKTSWGLFPFVQEALKSHLQLYSLIADDLLNTVTKGFREICEKNRAFLRGTVKSF